MGLSKTPTRCVGDESVIGIKRPSIRRRRKTSVYVVFVSCKRFITEKLLKIGLTLLDTYSRQEFVRPDGRQRTLSLMDDTTKRSIKVGSPRTLSVSRTQPLRSSPLFRRFSRLRFLNSKVSLGLYYEGPGQDPIFS